MESLSFIYGPSDFFLAKACKARCLLAEWYSEGSFGIPTHMKTHTDGKYAAVSLGMPKHTIATSCLRLTSIRSKKPAETSRRLPRRSRGCRLGIPKLTALRFCSYNREETVNSIRLLELRVPSHAATGGEALLGCQFDLQGDLLYSVSWYKDDKMFFRYKPGNGNTMSFPTKGITIDMTRSSSDVVTLVNLTTDSAGLYRCEVAGEKPRFDTAAAEKYITINILPKSSPQLSGMRSHYNFGQLVTVNCTSPASQPEAQLVWLINNRPVSKKQLLGPWKRVVDDPPDTTETTFGLRFRVAEKHFVNDIMELKCQSTIAPLYQREKVHRVLKPGTRPTTPEPVFSTDPLEPEDFKQISDNTFLWVLPQDTTVASPSNGNSVWRRKFFPIQFITFLFQLKISYTLFL
ncbi:uncharacterized protein LOC113227144 [Hyposmocoma kahamanoa]|uniref:uncharacterized protein LOC113227144 n=1 Tax=Hyposmocoma kahamanoa TaxID=1477025 RepID=UPI000E6D6177|nr:uncharacterized protein LOC113227144 [Hyposmocoma kahamanoa]